MIAVDTHHSLCRHEIDAALNNGLVEFHATKIVRRSKNKTTKMHLLGNTIHEQPTHTVVTIVDRDPVAGLVELVGGSETRRPRTDDRNLLPSPELRDLGGHPTHLEALNRGSVNELIKT